MSDKITKIIAVVALVFGLVAMVNSGNTPSVAGLYNTNPTHFFGGLSAGAGDQFAISDAGVIATTGAVVTTGNIGGATGIFSGKVGVASSTPSTIGDLSVGSTGTTTIYMGGGATSGSCLQLQNSAGTLTKLYVNGTTVVVAAGACR